MNIYKYAFIVFETILSQIFMSLILKNLGVGYGKNSWEALIILNKTTPDY